MLPNKSAYLAGAAFLCVSGCVTGRMSPVEPGDLDARLLSSTYVREDDLVAVIVSSRPAHFRLSESYLPFEIAVANKGLESLTLTRESFTLVDPDGKRYPLAARDEMARNYGSVDVDRRFSEAAGVVRSRFASFMRVPSNFSPGFDNGIARDHIALPRFGYFLDFIYFPRPAGEIAGRPMELWVAARELADPVPVRFQIEPGGKKRNE